jgi:dipeptidyl aminopeptidase/acylaminoacyl peptidase
LPSTSKSTEIPFVIRGEIEMTTEVRERERGREKTKKGEEEEKRQARDKRASHLFSRDNKMTPILYTHGQL